jgi:hypothetical protein
MVLAFLIGAAVAGCENVHGAASAGGGASPQTRGGQFILGSGIHF